MSSIVKTYFDDKGRVCTSCGKYKNWDNFYARKGGVNGKRADCKECVTARSIAYQIKHSEERSAYKKKWAKKNEKRLKYIRKKYYDETKDTRVEYLKKYNISKAKYITYKDKLTTFESPRKVKDGSLEVKCATCRRYFIPLNKDVKSRIIALTHEGRGEHRLYCSDSCKEACSVFGQNKYPKGFKVYSKREYSREFRQMILDRDDYTCQICGEQFETKHLQAHHITPVKCSPTEQADIDNGICVCKQCHSKLHEDIGCSYSELARA